MSVCYDNINAAYHLDLKMIFTFIFQKFTAQEMDPVTKMVIVIMKLACVPAMRILMAILANVSHNLLSIKFIWQLSECCYQYQFSFLGIVCFGEF